MFSPVKITLTLLLSLATFAAADSSDTTGVAPGANPANVRSKANNDPSYSNSENFEESILATHNKWRQEHSVDSVSWDPELAAYAQSISKRCEFRHSVGDSIDSYIPLILWGCSYGDVPMIWTYRELIVFEYRVVHTVKIFLLATRPHSCR